MVSGKTAVYGIIGNPVSHSLSPQMQNAALAASGYDGIYVPFPVDDVAGAVSGLRALGIAGASVTIPHKQAIIGLLDELDPVAAKIGAINTVVRRSGDGGDILVGYNTDWLGAMRAIEEKVALVGKRVLLLGAGGSARAIGFGLLERGALPVICSRTKSSGCALADELAVPWYDLATLGMVDADIVINATSVGMGSEVSLCSAEQLAGVELVMDIVYSPEQTTLLQNAKAAGAVAVSGLEMLLYQGVAQFELWHETEAPVAVMRKALRNFLDAKELGDEED